ncbi:UNVERIFIED_CONTAM: hypothetical protein FKN15_015461 [Acipenser sinensis]
MNLPKADSQDEDNLLTTLQTFNLFSSEVPQDLQNIATKDLATKQIEEDLLEARQKGQEQLNTFIAERLLPCVDIPQALAEMNGSLRSESKAILSQVLTAGIPCSPGFEATNLVEEVSLIIDGQALVIAIGKPQRATTFGDFADVFVVAVLQGGVLFRRIDVVFDRYYEASLKGGTGKRHESQATSIVVAAWDTDVLVLLLAHFHKMSCSKLWLKAGTAKKRKHIPIHAIVKQLPFEQAVLETSQATSIVVAAWDTDVLVLLLAHFHKMSCSKLWLKAGTAKKRKHIPIHAIVKQLPFEQAVLETMPAFHALTCRDTTSYLAGHSKNWKVFQQHHDLLKCLGEGDLDDQTAKDAELLICKVYYVPNTTTVNMACSVMFVKSHAPESLPPTSDALSFHIKCTHYQAAVWQQAHIYSTHSCPFLRPWGGDWMRPHFCPSSCLYLPSQSCMELITCNCTTRCMSAHCKCKKSHLLRTCSLQMQSSND